MLVSPPLRPADWFALTSGELWATFVLTCCVLEASTRIESLQLYRAWQLFLLANDCPRQLRKQWNRAWLRACAQAQGYAVRLLHNKLWVDGLQIQGGPVERHQLLEARPYTRAAEQRRLRKAAQGTARVTTPLPRCDLRWSDFDAVLDRFLAECCAQVPGQRCAVRDLKAVYKAWHARYAPRIPTGGKGQWRLYSTRLLLTRLLQRPEYRLVRPDNVPFVCNLVIAPALVAALPPRPTWRARQQQQRRVAQRAIDLILTTPSATPSTTPSPTASAVPLPPFEVVHRPQRTRSRRARQTPAGTPNEAFPFWTPDWDPTAWLAAQRQQSADQSRQQSADQSADQSGEPPRD